MKMIFKYFSDGVIDHVFNRDNHVGIKLSLPEDYNDPFELLLGVDLNQSAELLATYGDIVNEIPQLLTSCFSKSPVVAPMWAHYGNSHKGFVVGFDVSQIEKSFPDVMIKDISYLDSPSPSLVDFAEMAAYRKKPRDAMKLRNAVIYHGYFSKYSEWSYEQEVRAVNFEDYVEDVNGNSIMYIPSTCTGAIISGARSSDQTKEKLRSAALQLDADFYIEAIGRSYPKPYLLSACGNPRVFGDGELGLPDGVCEKCSEPLTIHGALCPWCSMEEADRIAAAMNNPFRLLDQYGLLENYIETFPVRPRTPYK